jgi:hypothetical protein
MTETTVEIRQPNVSTYTLVAGTPASETDKHEPRTITRVTRNEGLVQMMSETGDGQFVAWGTCDRCKDHVSMCKCVGGPVEPDYIGRWRAERFTKQVIGRLNPDKKEPVDYDDRPLAHPITSRGPAKTLRVETTDVATAKPGEVNDALDKAFAAVQAAKEADDSE